MSKFTLANSTDQEQSSRSFSTGLLVLGTLGFWAVNFVKLSKALQATGFASLLHCMPALFLTCFIASGIIAFAFFIMLVGILPKLLAGTATEDSNALHKQLQSDYSGWLWGMLRYPFYYLLYTYYAMSAKFKAVKQQHPKWRIALYALLAFVILDTVLHIITQIYLAGMISPYFGFLGAFTGILIGLARYSKALQWVERRESKAGQFWLDCRTLQSTKPSWIQRLRWFLGWGLGAGITVLKEIASVMLLGASMLFFVLLALTPVTAPAALILACALSVPSLFAQLVLSFPKTTQWFARTCSGIDWTTDLRSDEYPKSSLNWMNGMFLLRALAGSICYVFNTDEFELALQRAGCVAIGGVALGAFVPILAWIITGLAFLYYLSLSCAFYQDHFQDAQAMLHETLPFWFSSRQNQPADTSPGSRDCTSAAEKPPSFSLTSDSSTVPQK